MVGMLPTLKGQVSPWLDSRKRSALASRTPGLKHDCTRYLQQHRESVSKEQSSPRASLGHCGLPTAGLRGLTTTNYLYDTSEGNQGLACLSLCRVLPWNLTGHSLPKGRRTSLGIRKYSMSLLPEKWQKPCEVMGEHFWKLHPKLSWSSAFLCMVFTLLLLC